MSGMLRNVRPGDAILPLACHRDKKSRVMIPGCYSTINGGRCTCERPSVERRATLEAVLRILQEERLLLDGGMDTVPQHAVARAVRRIMELATATPRRKGRG